MYYSPIFPSVRRPVPALQPPGTVKQRGRFEWDQQRHSQPEAAKVGHDEQQQAATECGPERRKAAGNKRR
jgi:hypothetical protein